MSSYKSGQSDQGLHCLPLHLHQFDALRYMVLKF